MQSQVSNSERLEKARLALRDLSPPGCPPDWNVTNQEIGIRSRAAAEMHIQNDYPGLFSSEDPQLQSGGTVPGPHGAACKDELPQMRLAYLTREMNLWNIANCYAFAVNCFTGNHLNHDNALIPGTWGGTASDRLPLTIKDLIQSCQDDGLILVPGLDPPQENRRGHYLVAAYLGIAAIGYFTQKKVTEETRANDFHFIRRDIDGKWYDYLPFVRAAQASISKMLFAAGILPSYPARAIAFSKELQVETGFTANGMGHNTTYQLVALFWCPNAGLPLGNSLSPSFSERRNQNLIKPLRPICTSTECIDPSNVSKTELK